MKKKMILFIIGGPVLYTALFLAMNMGLMNTYFAGVLISILINVIVAVSLALVTGYLGELALGHAGFMAVGAYTCAIVTQLLEWPVYAEFTLGLVLGGCMAALMGVLIGLPALRLKGDYLGIMTLGFGEIIRIVLNNLKITNGARGLSGIPGYSNFTITFIIAFCTIIILYTFIHSHYGRAIIAIREDDIAASCSGLSTFYFKTFAFAFAAFFAGVGGGLYAHYNQVLTPKTFGFMYSIEFLVMVVIGGMGNLFGTVIAAIVLGVLNEALRSFAEYRMLIYSLILIFAVISKAKGFTFQQIIKVIKKRKED